MPVKVEQPVETASSFHVQIGNQWAKRDFGRELPLSEVAKHALAALRAIAGGDDGQG